MLQLLVSPILYSGLQSLTPSWDDSIPLLAATKRSLCEAKSALSVTGTGRENVQCHGDASPTRQQSDKGSNRELQKTNWGVERGREPSGPPGGRAAGTPTLPGQPAPLTCPRCVRQPLDSSPKPPLEKFPNFFAALHTLAAGRSEESQEEETAPAQTPGAGVHPRCWGRAFPALVPTLPRALRRRRPGKMRGGGWRGCDAQAASARPRTARGFTCKSSAFSLGAPRLRRWTSRAQHRPGSPRTGATWHCENRTQASEKRRIREHPAPATSAAAAQLAAANPGCARPRSSAPLACPRTGHAPSHTPGEPPAPPQPRSCRAQQQPGCATSERSQIRGTEPSLLPPDSFRKPLT
ncbi:hypothetical protein NN561_011551 [Cricetulus griseus]